MPQLRWLDGVNREKSAGDQARLQGAFKRRRLAALGTREEKNSGLIGHEVAVLLGLRQRRNRTVARSNMLDGLSRDCISRQTASTRKAAQSGLSCTAKGKAGYSRKSKTRS